MSPGLFRPTLNINGVSELTVGPCGFFVCEDYPFLGATPDSTVYDPSNLAHPFGFLEVKCPCFHKDRSPAEACAIPGFCSQLGTLPDGSKPEEPPLLCSSARTDGREGKSLV